MTYRLVVKEVAQDRGMHATFMPKPIQNQWGSGMHTHVSLFEGDRNVFYDANRSAHLSKAGSMFVAGLLRHAREMTAVLNQWVNSYKRLVPGYEAPTAVCWSRHLRSAFVRVPGAKPRKEASARVEIRSPDPACNPYLAFAVLLAAGMKGIEENYELPAGAEDDVWSLSDAERRALGYAELPHNLADALRAMEDSELVAETLLIASGHERSAGGAAVWPADVTAGKPHAIAGPANNPYFGRREAKFAHPEFPIYLVTRLAGYDFEDVKGTIDRSLRAANRALGWPAATPR